MIPHCDVVAGPGRRVTLRPGVGRAGQHKWPFVRPQFEQLEDRATPSSFAPASPAVSFTTPNPFPGVPFTALTPASGDIVHNFQGFDQSAAALTNAGVYGAAGNVRAVFVAGGRVAAERTLPPGGGAALEIAAGLAAAVPP